MIGLFFFLPVFFRFTAAFQQAASGMPGCRWVLTVNLIINTYNFVKLTVLYVRFMLKMSE